MNDKDFVLKVDVEVGVNIDGHSFVEPEISGKVKRSGNKKQMSLSEYSSMVAFLSMNIVNNMINDFNITDRETVERIYQETIGKMHEINIKRKISLDK